MEVSEIPQTVSSEPSPYEQCESCGAAVEHSQRYCVNCGTRRRHVSDPAARYFSSLTARSRDAAGPSPAARARRSGTSGLGLALVLAVIPLAVALGVVLGRASTDGDQRLVDQLRAQRPEVVTVSAGATPAAATAAASSETATALSSDFPLQNGYAVELQTLPASSGQAAVEDAERSDRGKGAPKVGLIVQSDFKVTPSPPAGDYVIYSGDYRTKTQAGAALAKLTKAFPHAKVIQVQSTAIAGAGQVVSRTQFGSARQISGFAKPTQSQLQQGAQVVHKIQQTQGKSYLNSQRNLPDQISVP
jgi:hypothetical protein